LSLRDLNLPWGEACFIQDGGGARTIGDAGLEKKKRKKRKKAKLGKGNGTGMRGTRFHAAWERFEIKGIVGVKYGRTASTTKNWEDLEPKGS